MAKTVVGFIDMDCFYVAVERQFNPALIGVPCAVVQYNSRQKGGAPDLPADADRCLRADITSGGIIAVSYEARRRGVTRQMNTQEARRHCPELVVVQVPTAFGKADLAIYKDAGDRVVSLLARRAGAVEKRSVDEVAIDITAEAERILREREWDGAILQAAQQASHLADSSQSRSATTVSRDETRRGHAGQQMRDGSSREQQELQGGWASAPSWEHSERRLVAGAVVVAELRAAIATELGFSCSGGVAENKVLAKLACGLHKPNQQTLVLPDAVEALLHDLPLERLPGLGGDLGAQVKESLSVSTASELAAVPWDRLSSAFPRQASFLLELAEGRRQESVQHREASKSLSNSKTFLGKLCLMTVRDCEHWLDRLAGELHGRYSQDLAKNGRVPSRISISVSTAGSSVANPFSQSSRQRAVSLGASNPLQALQSAARDCFQRWVTSSGRRDGALEVVCLGLSLSGMQPLASGRPISSFFKSQAQAPVDLETFDDCPAGGAEEAQARDSQVCKIDLTECGGSEVVNVLDVGEAELQPSALADVARVSGADPEFLAGLPPEIQAEVCRELLSKMGHGGLKGQAPERPAAELPAVKRRKRSAGSGIEMFLRPRGVT